MNSRQPLSFDLTVTPSTYDDPYEKQATAHAYVNVEAWPLVGGHRVIEGQCSYVFDIVAVLCHGVEPSDFDVFTCGCGVAGCAGIHEEVRLEVDADEVRWVFPEEPFRKELNPTLVVDGEPLVLRFERAQYEAALNSLKRKVLKVARESKVPVIVPPESHPDLDTPFREKLAAQRKRTAQWIADRRHRKVIFNKLLDTDVAVTFPFGGHYQISVPSLAWELSDNIVGDNYAIRDEVLEEKVLPRLHQGDEAILAAVRELSWEQVESFIWWDSSAGDDYTPLDTRDDMPAQWAGAQLHVRYRP